MKMNDPSTEETTPDRFELNRTAAADLWISARVRGDEQRRFKISGKRHMKACQTILELARATDTARASMLETMDPSDKRWMVDAGILVDASEAPGRVAFQCPPASAGARRRVGGVAGEPHDEVPGAETAPVARGVALTWEQDATRGIWCPTAPASEEISTGAVLEPDPHWWDGLERARREWNDRGHFVLRNVLPQTQIGALASYVRRLGDQGYFRRGDGHVEGRDIIYNEPMIQFWAIQLAGVMSSILDRPVRPSFSYLARYHPGSELSRHRDRRQCEWNVSLVLDTGGDEPNTASPWTLHLDPEDGRGPVGVDLRGGDVLVYQGHETLHWRERLQASHPTTVAILMYVGPTYEGPLA